MKYALTVDTCEPDEYKIIGYFDCHHCRKGVREEELFVEETSTIRSKTNAWIPVCASCKSENAIPLEPLLSEFEDKHSTKILMAHCLNCEQVDYLEDGRFDYLPTSDTQLGAFFICYSCANYDPEEQELLELCQREAEEYEQSQQQAPPITDLVNPPGKVQGASLSNLFEHLRELVDTPSLGQALDRVDEIRRLYDLGQEKQLYLAVEELSSIFRRLETKDLDPGSTQLIERIQRLLRTVQALLPKPTQEDLRFEALPNSLRELVSELIEEVEMKLGIDDAHSVTEPLRLFRDGSLGLSQSQLASELNKLMRVIVRG